MDTNQLNQYVVTIKSSGANGVVVPGFHVVTATHCLKNWSAEGRLVLGEPMIESVYFPSIKQTVTLAGLFADPFSDLAVLGLPDSQDFSDEFDNSVQAFEEQRAICISTDEICDDELNVMVRNFDGTWIGATASKPGGNHGQLWVESPIEIKDGASGGPIVTTAGALIGVVSSFGQSEPSDGLQPHLERALPPWLWEEMQDEDEVE